MTLPVALFATRGLGQEGGVANFASGFYTGTGDAGVIPIRVGFIPRYVKLVNLTDRISYEWFEGMTNTNVIKTVAAGTITLDANSCILVGDQVFSQSEVAYPLPGAQTPDDGAQGLVTITRIIPDRTKEPLSITAGTSGADVNVNAKAYAWMALG